MQHSRNLACLLMTIPIMLASAAQAATTWNLHNDYSYTSNPSGPWSYCRKWAVTATAADVMPVRWGNGGWYLGNVFPGSPSVQPAAQLWARDNANGYSAVRWTCPEDGQYDLTGAFGGADARGVNNFVYVVVNGTLRFEDNIAGYLDTASFGLQAMHLSTGDKVDFVVGWNSAGGVSIGYGWTSVDATIRRLDTPCVCNLNGDTTVDLADIALFSSDFFNGGASSQRSDFDGNGAVNLSDIAILASALGTSDCQ